MIDRVNCEGRRVLVKEEAKRRIKLGCAAAGALVAALLITTCPIPGLSYQATAVLGILIMAIVWWITGRSARVCYRGGDGGALRCGRRYLRWRDVLDVRVVYLVAFALGLHAGSRHEDERSYEAHRAGDCTQVPAYVPMPGHRSTCHGHGSRPLDPKPCRQRRHARPACHEHRGRAGI